MLSAKLDRYLSITVIDWFEYNNDLRYDRENDENISMINLDNIDEVVRFMLGEKLFCLYQKNEIESATNSKYNKHNKPKI